MKGENEREQGQRRTVWTTSSCALLCLVFSCCFFSLAQAVDFRVFTETSGRTVRGQLLEIKGDNVTIQEKDGATFTLPATDFCSLDIEYFRQHGLSAPAGAATGKEPEELTAARERYLRDYSAAWEPVKQRYLQYLEGLKRAAGAKGDLATSTALQKEIDAMAQPNLPDPGQAPPEVLHARENLQIEARRVLGPLKIAWVQGLEKYKRTLGAKGDVAGMTAAQKELDEAALKPAPGESQIVLWNVHNSHYNERGTKKLNLILYNGAVEVWRRDGLEMPWEPDKDLSLHVAVPEISIDRIRVEILDFVKHGGGLAEIEYLKSGKNVARGCRATASNYWEKNKNYLPGAVTDGNTSSAIHEVGYWLLENDHGGWIEVHLAR